jgi:4-aminobutyrate aminotransferase / (S)-3-amino-2-methylpropionate transaminase / 5-aminovalerate transaminase
MPSAIWPNTSSVVPTPNLKTSIPGPQSKRLLKKLHQVECSHITYVDSEFPVVWEKAKGCRVWDVDGNRYLDLTAAFGVSILGHSPSRLRKAINQQLKNLWHAMGDVYPHRSKIQYAEALKAFLPRELNRVIFSCSGSEAVESALKTAYLATGKPGVLAFDGAYHGLGYGALQANGRAFFREPFVKQTGSFVSFMDFIPEKTLTPAVVRQKLKTIDALIRHSKPKKIGAILIEPIQGRAGVRVADPYFLKGLRRLSRENKIVLIFDEIYTGLGRTGRWFAMDHFGVTPDIICLGKALAHGFPFSACVGKRELMKAWGPSQGEAKHTSTFLGHPLGCQMGLATLEILKEDGLLKRVKTQGVFLQKGLEFLAQKFPRLVKEIRGRGLMWGMEFKESSLAHFLMKRLLKRGIILLTSGPQNEVLTFTPCFIVNRVQLQAALDAIGEELTAFSKENS